MADLTFFASQALWPLRGPSLDPTSFFQAYLTAPVFLVCLVLAWVWKRGPIWLIPAHAIDLDVRLPSTRRVFARRLTAIGITDWPEVVVHRRRDARRTSLVQLLLSLARRSPTLSISPRSHRSNLMFISWTLFPVRRSSS